MPTASHYLRWGALLAILLCCVGCDQMTKEIARSHLQGQPEQRYLADTFRLVYAENPGAFLGLGGQLPPRARWLLLVVVNTLVALGIAVMLLWHSKMPAVRTLACALLLGGAIGNLIDRVRFDGLVIDFMNLGIGPLRTGIFNVADVAISVGAVLLILPHFAPAAPEDPAAKVV
jgi:signal peptidase II